MFYYDSAIITAMAKERLSRRGQLIKLDMDDYYMLTSGRKTICAVRVKSELEFLEFLSELQHEMSVVQAPAGVIVHLTAHPEADVTMQNFSLLGRTLQELFSEEIQIKIGYASDDTLPNNGKDMIVFIAGN